LMSVRDCMYEYAKLEKGVYPSDEILMIDL
jgi:hypothetical protein